jgi:hypothetical protein
MNNNEESLLAGLRALAASDSRTPPPALEASLVRRLKPRRTFPWPLALEVLAAAALLLIAIFPRPQSSAAEGFIPVPYATPIGPHERAELVHVSVPATALAQWGLPITDFNPSQRVDADVVIGEDGLARAVRFTQ